MATSDSARTRDAFRGTLGIVTGEQVRTRFVIRHDKFWPILAAFCAQHHCLEPYLPTLTNRIPFLCVFAQQRYRDGTLAYHHQPVRSKQMQKSLRSVATGFTELGLVDPLAPLILRGGTFTFPLVKIYLLTPLLPSSLPSMRKTPPSSTTSTQVVAAFISRFFRNPPWCPLPHGPGRLPTPTILHWPAPTMFEWA
jgi:hypothetical protein